MRGIEFLVGTDEGIHVIVPGEAGRLSPVGKGGVSDISLVPGDPDVIFCGLWGGGVSKSRDGGRTWKPCGLEGAEVHALSVHPLEPKVVFVGVEPAAIFRSDDGGKSWRELKAVRELPSVPSWTFPVPPHQAHVRTFAFHPKEALTLYAGIEVGGVIGTKDGGESWEELNQGVFEDIHQLAIHPKDSRRLYAATGGGFYRTKDAGRSWRESEEGLDRYYCEPILIRPSSPHPLYIGVSHGPMLGSEHSVQGSLLFRSDDDGASFRPLALPGKMKGRFRGKTVAFHPEDPRFLFAGTSHGEVYQSEDENWSRIFQGLPPIYVLTLRPL